MVVEQSVKGRQRISAAYGWRADEVELSELGNRGSGAESRFGIREMSNSPDGVSLPFRLSAGALQYPGSQQIRHRHSFDQVRLTLRGKSRFGNVVKRPWDLSYHPEGVFYGPQSVEGDEPHGGVGLQFPGPSQGPYPTVDEQFAAVAELSKTGEFRDGKYFTEGRTADGFEILMEHFLGHKVDYPKGRYAEAVFIKTEAVPWVALRPGVALKHLGYFTEVGPNIKFVKLEPGARLDASANTWHEFRWTLEGQVNWADGQSFPALSAMYCPEYLHYLPMAAGDEGATLLVVQYAADAADPVPFIAI